MKKYKKPLFIALIALDIAVTIFLFVISIIILATVVPAENLNEAKANASVPIINAKQVRAIE